MGNHLSQEINLHLEFDTMEVEYCNFNLKGELIFSCTAQMKDDKVNMVCVYSIQTEPTRTKCQKIYEIPKEAEVLSISKHDKVWLRHNNDLYEWNLLTGHTMILSRNLSVVID